MRAKLYLFLQIDEVYAGSTHWFRITVGKLKTFIIYRHFHH